MREQIRVRLYATCAIRVPLDTEIDLDEFREWYQDSGAVFDPDGIDTDAVVEFINASPDDETEYARRFPTPDANAHEVWSFDIDEAEVLGQEAGGE